MARCKERKNKERKINIATRKKEGREATKDLGRKKRRMKREKE